MVRRNRQHDGELTRRVGFRLSDAEYTRYLEKVAASGMSASAFFRDCVLTNRTKVIARLRTSADRRRVLFVVNRVGNNLNQIARVANEQRLEGKLSETVFIELLDELELIQQLLKAHLYRVD